MPEISKSSNYEGIVESMQPGPRLSEEEKREQEEQILEDRTNYNTHIKEWRDRTTKEEREPTIQKMLTGQELTNKDFGRPEQPIDGETTKDNPQGWTQEEIDNANPLQEIGTALFGSGIDLVEEVGSLTERTAKFKWLDKDWEPSWLQWDDKTEPLNKTVWGNFFRLGSEVLLDYAIISAGVTLTATGLGAAAGGPMTAIGLARVGSKLKRVSQAANWLRKTKTTARGAWASAAIYGGAVDFINSHSKERTANDALKDVLPWMPEITTTSDESSPLEIRLKNVLEGGIMGEIIGGLVSWRKAYRVAIAPNKRAQILKEWARMNNDPTVVRKVGLEMENLQKIIDNPKSVEEKTKAIARLNRLQNMIDQWMELNPEVVYQNARASYSEALQNAEGEAIQLKLFDDPTLKYADPTIHKNYFDSVDKSLRTVEPGSMYEHMKNMLSIASRGDYQMGRRVNLLTNAAIKRITKDNAALGKQLRAFSKEIAKGLTLRAGQNVAGMGLNLNAVNILGISKYMDIINTFPDLAGTNFDQIKKLLLEDSNKVRNLSTGTLEELPNSANAQALEMLMYDLNSAVADKATFLHSVVDKVPHQHAMDQLLDTLEGALMMNQKASEFAGSILRARRGLGASGTEALEAPLAKAEKIKEFMGNFRKVIKSNPEMTRGMLQAFAETNGDAASMEAIRRYAVKAVRGDGWKQLLISPGKQSELMKGVFTTLYNSILSGPRTLARAFTGTNLLAILRPMQIVGGGIISGDKRTVSKGLYMGFHNMFGTISEAWELAGRTHYALINNQTGPYVNQLVSPTETAHWKSLGAIIEATGNEADKFSYRLTSTIKDFNNQSWVRYPSNALQTIDAFSSTLIGRQEVRAKAFDAVFDASDGKVTKELLEKVEKTMYDQVFNETGEIVDLTAELAAKEVALQKPLSPRLAQIQATIEAFPILRPFFLFMKTGVNAIDVVAQHTPIIARFNDQVNAILKASPNDLATVMKYGIRTPAELSAAKALVKGRIATGYLTIGGALGLTMTGRLTGNGPADRTTYNSWIQNGWRPRSIKLGDKWVDYSGLEPFASILAVVADITDMSQTIGSDSTENLLRKTGYLISMNLTNKSFLSGLRPLNDLFSFDFNRSAVYGTNLINNFIPFSSARNELANIINPGLRELENDVWSTFANRNPILRGTLPVQYDPLDGSIIKDFDFPTRMWNSISPFSISGKDTPTRKLLRDSGYDLAATFSTDSLGNVLNPQQRSRLQALMGGYNIEKELEELFKNPKIVEELRWYAEQRAKGIGGDDRSNPRNLPLENAWAFRRIDQIFQRAKRRAEAQLFKEFPSLRQEAAQRNSIRLRQREPGNTQNLERFLETIPTR